MSDTLRITGIDIRDFKRVKAFSMRLDDAGSLVTIGGDNAQGKSSVLDAIEATLTGVPRSISQPVRNGAGRADIRVVIPPYKVLRSWEDGKPRLTVLDASGGQVSNPSKFLKDLVGSVFVDPVAFLDMEPRDQRKVLADLVGIDTEAADAEIKEANFEVKTLEQRKAGLVVKVEDMPWHDGVPETELSVEGASKALQEALDQNAEGRRLGDVAKTASERAVSARQSASDAASEVERIRKQLADAEDRAKGLDETAKTLNAEAEQAVHAANSYNFVDEESARKSLEGLSEQNRKVRENAVRRQAFAECAAAEEQIGLAVKRRDELQAKKKKALAEASFPVPGLGFDETGITLGDVPFAQASHAEQISVAVAISVAQGGRVKPVFIRDASTIGKKMLAVIANEADKLGAQVFAEVVANEEAGEFDRECSFYIVDGLQWKAEPQEAQGSLL